ncbi:MAG: type II toxin-antitoxin system RelE/ParE family toxin [bacterium]
MNYKILTSRAFDKDIKDLQKKYKSIKRDLEGLLDLLGLNPLAGEVVHGFDNKVFKARMSSSDMKRGKSKGFRVIYYVSDRNRAIYLLTIYPKARRENILPNEIRYLLKEVDMA